MRIERSKRQRLYWLIDLVIAGELSINDFARGLDKTYQELEDGDLTDEEEHVITALHRDAGSYALPEDRGSGTHPYLRTEADILKAVKHAKSQLRRRDA